MREADSVLVEEMLDSGKVEKDYLGSGRVEEMFESDSHWPSNSASGQGKHNVLEMVLIRNVSRGSEVKLSAFVLLIAELGTGHHSIKNSGSSILKNSQRESSNQKIFNTYGELSNASLLHRHGFTEPDNPYDIVNIEFTLVLQYSSLFFSERLVRNRVRLWRKYGCCALSWKTTEYFEIEACGKPQQELLFLLYILHLPEKAVLAADIALHEVETGREGNHDLQWEVKATKTINSFLESEHGVTDMDRVFLTVEVCKALLWLCERRDEAYGETSLEEDLMLLNVVSPTEEPKWFHALSLRIGERSILKRLNRFICENLQGCR
ncbi:hypothetical protein L7F22_014289 [Adiantum nelumboides]|nr:hypothetical protein [Adiantum nelumboides]